MWMRCRRDSNVAGVYEQSVMGKMKAGCYAQTSVTAHCWNGLIVSKTFERLATEQIRR
jgi:hypothetical protein